MDPTLPKMLAGRYAVRGILFRTPETVVVNAFDERLAVPRALKLIRPEHRQNMRLHGSLHTEARVLTMVSHPQILRAFDLADDDTVGPVLVMPQLQGTPLDVWLADEGRLAPGLAVRIVSDVLLALQCAHEHSVQHNHVCPSSVLLRRDGRAQLMDFGRATLQPSTQGRIQLDLNGVAALLFQLLAGHDGGDLVHAALNPTLGLWAGLPDALAPVVRRGSHPGTELQYASAVAMQRDLLAAGRETPKVPPPRRPPQRT